MTRHEHLRLLAERTSLQKMIAETPAEDVLDLASLEARLAQVDALLAGGSLEPEPARVRVTFNGRPVVGSHGIFAEFGAKAVGGFTEVVAMMAASLTAPLAPTGPIPNRQDSQMLITGTALGSFGFELEEHQPTGQMPLQEQSPVAAALERTQALLAGVLGTDDELADSAAEVDPRAIEKLRSFLTTLADNEAVCTIRFGERQVRFADVGQVQQSIRRLSQQNLHEEEKEFEGEFQGVLPKSRAFEFKLLDGVVIRGKVGRAISNADALNQILHQRKRIRLAVTKVGSGPPRYVLTTPPSDVTLDPAS